MLFVRRQLLQVADDTTRRPCPYCSVTRRLVVFGEPETAGGDDRMVELDRGTVGVLLGRRLRQDEDRRQWRRAYVDHGLVFARADGQPTSLEHVTKRFRALAIEAGVRPVRLHTSGTAPRRSASLPASSCR